MKARPFHAHGIIRRLLIGLRLGWSVAAMTLAASAADAWRQGTPMPGARASHSAVWTGREMIVWGGGIDGRFLNTGARYVPATDTWRPTATDGAPSPRWFHAAVWTGREMIVWGGRADFFSQQTSNDGARYNPETDTWSPMSTAGAPSPRAQCAAVWTGKELVIWGGATEGGAELNDGARYNPETDTWASMSGASGLEPRMEPTGIWTGSELIVFGGMKFTGGQQSFGDGARYRPLTDTWTALPPVQPQQARTGHTAVWTGERMLIWGGRQVPQQTLLLDGLIYTPGLNQWSVLPGEPSLPARMYHAAVWTGDEMIVWGGMDFPGPMLNSGARFQPATGAWTATTTTGAAGKRQFWRPDLGVWTGEAMLIAGGSDYPASLDSTFLYLPEGGLLPTPTACLPPPPGLVGWWRGEGNANDALGNGDGTPNSGVTFEPGRVGQAFRIDGISGRINVPDQEAFKLVDGLTIEAWVKLINRDSGLMILMRGDDRPGLDPYFLGVDQGRIIFGISDEIGDDSIGTPLGMNQWRHVAGTFDGATGTLMIYVDGLLGGQLHTTRKPARELQPEFSPGLGIGNLNGNAVNFPWDGWLDEVSLYNRALSGDEINAIYQAGAFGKCADGIHASSPAFDLSRDFSSTQNPSGAWAYGYLASSNGPLNLLTFPKTFAAENGVPIAGWQLTDAYSPSVNKVLGPGTEPAISEGGAFVAAPGTVYVWPGNEGSPGEYGIVRLSIPSDQQGTYRFETHVQPTFDGPKAGDTEFHVRLNGAELLARFLPPNTGSAYTNTLTLSAGDRIDFVIGKGADHSADHSSLKLQVQLWRTPDPTPPPADCVPVPSDLVGWWRAEGNALDETGAHPGTIVGNVTYAPGKVGQGFHFDGTGGYVRIPNDDALDFPNELSIELWYKAEITEAAGYGLVTTRGTEIGPVNYGISAIPIGIGPYFNDPTVSTGDDAAQGGTFEASRFLPVPAKDKFHHLGVTYHQADADHVELRTYIDGALARTRLLPARLALAVNDAAIVIGRSAEYGAEVFQGVIDEVAIYRRALSSEEMAAIAGAGAAGKCAPAPAPESTTADYDLSRDFTLGQWSYGYRITLAGTFTRLLASRTFAADNGVPIGIWDIGTLNKPFVAKVLGPGTASSDGQDFTAPAGTVYFGPDPETATTNFSDIRFTVPAGAGALYRVEAAVQTLFDLARSVDADFSVLKGDQLVYHRFLPANSAWGYTNVFLLAQGETMDFLAGRGSGRPDTGLKISAVLRRLTDAPTFEEAMELVETVPAPFDRDSLRLHLDRARAALWRGLRLAALHHLQRLEEELNLPFAGAAVSPLIPLSETTQNLIESTDPDHSGRSELLRRATQPPRIRVLSLPPGTAGGVEVESEAVPGSSCLVLRSANLLEWAEAGLSTETSDGMFHFQDSSPAGMPWRFYRLKVK